MQILIIAIRWINYISLKGNKFCYQYQMQKKQDITKGKNEKLINK